VPQHTVIPVEAERRAGTQAFDSGWTAPVSAIWVLGSAAPPGDDGVL